MTTSTETETDDADSTETSEDVDASETGDVQITADDKLKLSIKFYGSEGNEQVGKECRNITETSPYKSDPRFPPNI